MDDNHHRSNLPAFPTAGGHLPAILPNPQTFYLTNSKNNINPFYEQVIHKSSHFAPALIQPYGYLPIIESKDEGRRVIDAWNTKVARTKRRLARQRSLSLTKTSSLPSSSSSSSGVISCNSNHNNDEYYSKPATTLTQYPNTTSHSQSNKSTSSHNLFTFCTPDKKVLRMLLKKDLKNSDVGSLGRIVLPKREAEENLPLLTDKEGMLIEMRDVKCSDRKWTMKYKYWINNRSRMYVLENTGEFVKQNRLLMGDIMTLYEDEDNNFYVNVDRGENHPMVEESYEVNMNNSQHYVAYPTVNIKDEEEEASLALLIEQFRHKTEDDELSSYYCINNNNNNNNNLVVSNPYFGMGIDSEISYMSNTRRAVSSSSSSNNIIGASSKGSYNYQLKEEEVDLEAMNNGFEDCFNGLDTLPDVSGFNFHPFDYLNLDRT